ncbi:MAG: zinc-ribbon domain-containing protein [Chthoniobacteraceae bacterium]
MAAVSPSLALQFHSTKNGDLTAETVLAGSARKVWWQCENDPTHVWKAQIKNRVRLGGGCPKCRVGWTLPAVRAFVDGLKHHLHTFTPAELYVLFQQNGLLGGQRDSQAFLDALATGRFPFGEIEKFCRGEKSLVDRFLADQSATLENLTGATASGEEQQGELGFAGEAEAEEAALPAVETVDVLRSLQSAVVVSADQEVVEFLVASALAKIWRHAFRDEAAALAQARGFTGDAYADRVRTDFLAEHERAAGLPIPAGYAFAVDGVTALPNLMQRLTAARVLHRRRVGNWSGTGAGKTLSAVLASRAVDARLTVVCCPNSVVEGWRAAILASFPHSVVGTKTFAPDWAALAGDATGFGSTPGHRYLVLNYEMFQQDDSEAKVRDFAEAETADFIVVDEVHFTKQRTAENLSRRKRLVSALIALAGAKQPQLCVLGMSATPVINNLQEGRSLVEMISGLEHPDIETRPTVANCMKLHQRLVSLGTRWVPKYDAELEQCEVPIDCGDAIEEIRALGRAGSPLALEQILTRVRLPIIRREVRRKTLLYTHYLQGIEGPLRDALTADGWRVGFFTGDDKSGLDGFLRGDVDVLIGSSAIGTGVDGLQDVCERLIVNVLPWTNAEFEQLKGRIYRQGQRAAKVTVVLPLTFASVNGERWSWCESKMRRLKFKKSIADAAVDGVVPEGHLRSPAQAYVDVMGWLGRLTTGEVEVVSRMPIAIALSPDAAEAERRTRSYGDLSAMNNRWNQTNSAKTAERLQLNPNEWAHYHTLYREARNTWAVVPFEEVIRWAEKRSGYVIGDFGCGEARLATALADRHTVHSFDYVAANEDVIACDMAHVPMDEEALDVAVFSLSLMGANFTDYLREAWRLLKLDGHLHIYEATSRFTDRNGFADGLKRLGFSVVTIEDAWKFTHIHALKVDLTPDAGLGLAF